MLGGTHTTQEVPVMQPVMAVDIGSATITAAAAIPFTVHGTLPLSGQIVAWD